MLAIIPSHNEDKTIVSVIKGIQHHLDEILVIDDGSTDNTLNLVKDMQGVSIIHHRKRQGYGKSLIDGFDYCIKNGVKFAVTIDADGQHCHTFIPIFLKEIKNVDIVSGSRYLPNSEKKSKPPKDRIRINKIITKLINRYTKYNITDSFCGFKAYKTRSLRNLKLTECGYGFPLQLWLQAFKNNLKVKEIPVPLIYNNYNRQFNDAFNSPVERLKYYKEIIKKEVVR